jgi:hypothetical protein
LVFGFFGSVYGENRLRYRKPNFLDTKTETEPNYQKNRNFGSVRYGSVRFSVYGKNVPTPMRTKAGAEWRRPTSDERSRALAFTKVCVVKRIRFTFLKVLGGFGHLLEMVFHEFVFN